MFSVSLSSSCFIRFSPIHPIKSLFFYYFWLQFTCFIFDAVLFFFFWRKMIYIHEANFLWMHRFPRTQWRKDRFSGRALPLTYLYLLEELSHVGWVGWVGWARNSSAHQSQWQSLWGRAVWFVAKTCCAWMFGIWAENTQHFCISDPLFCEEKLEWEGGQCFWFSYLLSYLQCQLWTPQFRIFHWTPVLGFCDPFTEDNRLEIGLAHGF